MAYNRLLFFSLTKYTLPTSPFPINLILSKLAGPTSTFRTLMEFELYVRLNAMTFLKFGGCFIPSLPLPLQGNYDPLAQNNIKVRNGNQIGTFSLVPNELQERCVACENIRMSIE